MLKFYLKNFSKSWNDVEDRMAYLNMTKVIH